MRHEWQLGEGGLHARGDERGRREVPGWSSSGRVARLARHSTDLALCPIACSGEAYQPSVLPAS
jgi:hypothetical protein